ncbi:MAG: hypothetical protein K2M99_08365 [Treponemataceae bacterium]|nr:hypothetical protein [Treponemataceae bacterium]
MKNVKIEFDFDDVRFLFCIDCGRYDGNGWGRARLYPVRWLCKRLIAERVYVVLWYARQFLQGLVQVVCTVFNIHFIAFCICKFAKSLNENSPNHLTKIRQIT